MRVRQFLQIAGGILIASVGLYIFFRDVDTRTLLHEIKTTRVWVVGALAALAILSLWIRSLRWKLMLPATGNSRGLFPVVVIGFMLNNVLPARLGEAARAVLLFRRHGFTVTQSVGSLLLERFLDLMVFTSFFFVPVLVNGKLAMLSKYALLFAACFAAAVCGLAFYARFPGLTRNLWRRAAMVLPGRVRLRAIRIGSDLMSNLDWVHSWRRVGAVIVLSILLTMCYPVMLVLLARAFPAFGLLEGMFGAAFAALGAAIPLAPGYVGTLHATLQHGLSFLGMSPEKSGAMAIVYHAVTYLAVTALGLYYYLSTNITFREIRQANEELKQ